MNNIYITSKVEDAKASVAQAKMSRLELEGAIKNVSISSRYIVDKDFTHDDLSTIGSLVSNPVAEDAHVGEFAGPADYDVAIEVGFLPGVTDNVGSTVKEIIQDYFHTTFTGGEAVYSSRIYFIKGSLSEKDIAGIADSLYNPLIQKTYVHTAEEFRKHKGSGAPAPKVMLRHTPRVTTVNILDAGDEVLEKIGSDGIPNDDGTTRGPLALHLTYMKAIQSHFKKLGRNPTDIELESLAQTWSEHCKHTIFADPIDEIKDGLYKTYIKRATEVIRKKRGRNDFCVSVFKDNSGAIAFDKDFLITHKVETHNSPSALDPFGGAITGIVGVNRDALGFGLGAKPIANLYGFCFADPRDTTVLYRDAARKDKMLSSYRIMQGVVEGINAGGNTSGIPTPLGFMYFDPRYRGKPLVFAGTMGLIPRKIKSRLSHQKQARNGDYIVMIGGRVGRDGIHGATFSSQDLNESSPAGSVQIGDPITQKKFSDAIVREARELNLYNSITDDGAGGLSSSVAEMARESGGARVELEKVPLKYPGLDPWQIWVSESQERMTLAVPPGRWKAFKQLMDTHAVEATVIGTFTNSGRCVITHEGKTIMDMDMDFLHDGLPPRPMKTRKTEQPRPTPLPQEPHNLTEVFHDMLKWNNNTSYEFVSKQYDHEVLSNSVIKPLQGKGRINGEAAVIRPVLTSSRGVVIGSGMYPAYSDLDTYHMSAAAIDSAVRTAITAGAPLSHIALLDNFCWSSSDDPKRLYELKRAAQACYDYATAYETPFISGKDSMFNDFKGYDDQGNKIKISVPPTLLISSVAVVEDHTNTVSIDAKMPGDLVYLLGGTYEELGGSQYLLQYSENSVGKVPQVNAKKNRKLYDSYHSAVMKHLVTSAVPLTKGGLAVAIARNALAGLLGTEIRLKNVKGAADRNDVILFSESQGRILVTVNPSHQKAFEKVFAGQTISHIGHIADKDHIRISGVKGNTIIDTPLEKAMSSYKSTFASY